MQLGTSSGASMWLLGPYNTDFIKEDKRLGQRITIFKLDLRFATLVRALNPPFLFASPLLVTPPSCEFMTPEVGVPSDD